MMHEATPMSTTVFLSLPPIDGHAHAGTQKATGSLTPAVFRRKPIGEDLRNFSLGVTHEATVIEIIPVASAISEGMVRTLGYRWLWFVRAMLERDIALSEELAREAWFAANREPLDFNRAATQRGIDVMRRQLGDVRVNEIREMNPPPI